VSGLSRSVPSGAGHSGNRVEQLVDIVGGSVPRVHADFEQTTDVNPGRQILGAGAISEDVCPTPPEAGTSSMRVSSAPEPTRIGGPQ
jgi:hypothetical protein